MKAVSPLRARCRKRCLVLLPRLLPTRAASCLKKTLLLARSLCLTPLRNPLKRCPSLLFLMFQFMKMTCLCYSGLVLASLLRRVHRRHSLQALRLQLGGSSPRLVALSGPPPLFGLALRLPSRWGQVLVNLAPLLRLPRRPCRRQAMIRLLSRLPFCLWLVCWTFSRPRLQSIQRLSGGLTGYSYAGMLQPCPVCYRISAHWPADSPGMPVLASDFMFILMVLFCRVPPTGLDGPSRSSRSMGIRVPSTAILVSSGMPAVQYAHGLACLLMWTMTATTLSALPWRLRGPGALQFLRESPVCIHFDATSAGYAAGSFQPRRPSDLRSAAALARYCFQALEAAGHQLQWQWVRGHSGSVGNEVCDAVSRACAADVWEGSPISHFAWQAFCSPCIPWLWRVFDGSCPCPDLAALLPCVRATMSRPTPVTLSLSHPLPLLLAAARAQLSLNFCSFNVQTLRDVKSVLWEQFSRAKMHVVGLQETRLKHSSMIEGSLCFEFHAPASRGDGGVSLLFSRTAPYGYSQGKPLRFANHHFRCFHSNSRCIGVCVRAPFLSLTVIAAHGPHSGNSRSAIQQWWSELASVSPARAEEEVVVLADCNARLGSVVSEGVGDHAASEECTAGAAVRSYAKALGLWIPSTFSDADGNHASDAHEPTWHAPAGGDSRIDYVLLPRSWRQHHCRPRVWRDLVLLREHDDHWPVVTICAFARLGAGLPAHPPRTVRDPALLDSGALFALDFTWHSMGQVPWQVDVHSHTQYIFDHLSTCLPMLASGRSRRRTFLPDSTLQVVYFCRTMKRHLGFL